LLRSLHWPCCSKHDLALTLTLISTLTLTLTPTLTLSFAGDHDDRVVPLHSHKLTATLQHVLCEDADSAQSNPLVTRIDVRAGHGAGKPTEKIIAGTPIITLAPNWRLRIWHWDRKHMAQVTVIC